MIEAMKKEENNFNNFMKSISKNFLVKKVIENKGNYQSWQDRPEANFYMTSNSRVEWETKNKE